MIAEFFTTSVAVHVTTVSPNGNTSGASFVKERTPTVSFTSGMVNSTVCFEFDDSTTKSGRKESTGGTVSTTVIVWVAIPTFPAPSIAVQIMVVAPIGNCAGALLISDCIPLSSLAVALPIEIGVNPPAASTNMSFGAMISGFVKSFGTGLTVVNGCVSCTGWVSSTRGSTIFVVVGVSNF